MAQRYSLRWPFLGARDEPTGLLYCGFGSCAISFERTREDFSSQRVKGQDKDKHMNTDTTAVVAQTKQAQGKAKLGTPAATAAIIAIMDGKSPAAAEVSQTAIQEAAEVAEMALIDSTGLAHREACAATGLNNLFKIARKVGVSVDKFGYPEVTVWKTFMTILMAQGAKVDFRKRDQLFTAAKGAVGTGEGSKLGKEEITKAANAFVTSKGKASADGKASCTLRMKAPRAWDIALGD